MMDSQKTSMGTFLVAQRLRLRAYNAFTGSIPGGGNKIPHSVQCSQEKKESHELSNMLALNVSSRI